jgi:hypothetical protein
MKCLSFILILLFLVSCASPAKKPTQITTITGVDLAIFKNECDREKKAASCARYGYLMKDYAYKKKACELGDHNSCYNVGQMEANADEYNFTQIRSQKEHVFGCYVNNTIDKNAYGKKVIDLYINIDRAGKIDSLQVEGRRLSDKFISCVMTAYSSKKFIGQKLIKRYSLGLIMPTQKQTVYKGKGGFLFGQ